MILENQRDGLLLDNANLESWKDMRLPTTFTSSHDLDLFKLIALLYPDRALLHVLTISNGQASAGEIFGDIRKWGSDGFVGNDGSYRPSIEGEVDAHNTYSVLHRGLYSTPHYCAGLVDQGILLTARRPIVDPRGTVRPIDVYQINPALGEFVVLAANIMAVLKTTPELSGALAFLSDPRFLMKQHYASLEFMQRQGLEPFTIRQLFIYLHSSGMLPSEMALDRESYGVFSKTTHAFLTKMGLIDQTEPEGNTYGLREDYFRNTEARWKQLRPSHDNQALSSLVFAEFGESDFTLRDVKRVIASYVGQGKTQLTPRQLLQRFKPRALQLRTEVLPETRGEYYEITEQGKQVLDTLQQIIIDPFAWIASVTGERITDIAQLGRAQLTNGEGRLKGLSEMLPFQRAAYEGVFLPAAERAVQLELGH